MCGCVALDGAAISGYASAESEGMGWAELFHAVSKEHDDGHAAKFMRALRHDEDVSRRFERGEWEVYFP